MSGEDVTGPGGGSGGDSAAGDSDRGDTRSERDDSGNTMRLVKWLVIVAIGIPVLVEVLTLFNLVQVRIFSDKDPVSEVHRQDRSTTADGVPVLREGDRLTPEGELPVLRLREKLIEVTPQEWQFTMSLAPDSLDALDSRGESGARGDVAARFRFYVDSLRLRSGEMLGSRGPMQWPVEVDSGEGAMAGAPEILQFRWRWPFPPGDLPQRLYVRFEWEGGTAGGGDSLRVVRSEFGLGNIPTRYKDGAQEDDSS